MENNASENSFLGNPINKEEKAIKFKDDHEEGAPLALEIVNSDDQLKSAKAEIGEIREENERLKQLVDRIAKEYHSLQMHFFDILQQEDSKKLLQSSPNPPQGKEESELVSLCLGRASTSSSDHPKKDSNKLSDGKLFDGGLELGLDFRFEERSSENSKNHSSENSLEEVKEDQEMTEMWPPSKTLKTVRSCGADDEVSQQSHLKKARVSVRARCEAQTMNDGCQWRKYGQKIAKGNPCPRAYYRCTVSPTCPVRKQVQRSIDDMSILITTYEGTHNHPLPLSATAMASTTSAAASMLQSHSSTSQPGIGTSASAPLSISSTTNLHGFDFSVSQSQKPHQHQLYFPNSTISTNNSHPTITLDLTGPSSISQFRRTFPSFSSIPRYGSSSTCLNFSSSSSSSFSQAFHQTPWRSDTSFFNHGSLSHIRNQNGSLTNNVKQPFFELGHQPFMRNQNILPHSLTESMAATAATKSITSNPEFQTALAAALSSFVGNGRVGVRENHGGSENLGLNLKWNESFNANPSNQSNGIGCASSYLNKTSSLSNQRQGDLVLFPPSMPLSSSKNASASSAANKLRTGILSSTDG